MVGSSYDPAGNLLSDGTTNSTSDALGATASRTVGGQTTSYGYTGDGVLAKATTPTTTTNYLQDFAASLAQVLNDGTATALYGHERLAAQRGRAAEIARRPGQIQADVAESCQLARTTLIDWKSLFPSSEFTSVSIWLRVAHNVRSHVALSAAHS